MIITRLTDDPDGLQFRYDPDDGGGFLEFAIADDNVTLTASRGIGRPSRYPAAFAPAVVGGTTVPNLFTLAAGVTLPA